MDGETEIEMALFATSLEAPDALVIMVSASVKRAERNSCKSLQMEEVLGLIERSSRLRRFRLFER